MHANRTISWLGRVFVVLVVLQLAASMAAWAQKNKPAAKIPDASTKPGPTTKGSPIPMAATTTVADCVAVEAALLPKEPAQQLFGGWVATNYAVVRVNISNRCKDQQMILHDVFFDYSNWGLSGLLPSQRPPELPVTDTYTQKTRAGQVASMGAKEVRDEIKEASVFSPRNLIVNGLVLVGTAAGGYSFLLSSDYGKGVAAYSSEFIPGLQKFWPDRRPDQESQVLLYGFQVNKVVSKQTADFAYAFFPIDRFLTPGLKKLFLKTPAVFFNPSLIFLDHSVKAFDPLRESIKQVTGVSSEAEILRELNNPCSRGMKSTENPDGEEDCDLPKTDSGLATIRKVKGTLASVSLNSVQIVVSGIMTVDVDSIPATINAVTLDGDKPLSKAGKVTGIITGKFLTNGIPEISDTLSIPGKSDAKLSDYIEVKSIAAVAVGASDTKLPFTFNVTAKGGIPSGSKLTFQVKKLAKSGDNAETTQTESMKFEYLVGEAGATTDAPEITKKPVIDNDATKAVWDSTTEALTGTITGKNLKDGTLTIPDVKLGATDETAFVDAKSITVNAAKSTDTILSFSFKLLKPVSVGSKVSFVVTTTDAEGKPLKSSANDDYTVPKSSAAETPADKSTVKKKAHLNPGAKPGSGQAKQKKLGEL